MIAYGICLVQRNMIHDCTSIIANIVPKASLLRNEESNGNENEIRQIFS